VLSLFCDRDLEINLMTLKPENDLDILNMYLHTENVSWSKVKVKMSKALNYFERYRNRYPDQTISGEQFLS